MSTILPAVILAVLLIAVAPATPEAALATTEAEILRLEDARIEAMIARDFATLEALMTPDAVHVESDGTARTTDEFMANFRRQRSTFETFVVDDSRVRFFGDAAIVTGRYHNALREDGKVLPTKNARFTRVWVRQPGGSWRMIAHQATAMTAQPAQ